MENTMYEFLFKKKKSANDQLFTVFIVFSAFTLFVLSVNAVTILLPFIAGFAFLLLFPICWAASYFIKSKYTEYEYNLMNGEMEIDKIIAKSKRTNLAKIDFKNIEICASIKDESKRHILKNQNAAPVEDYSSGYCPNKVYFVDFFENSQRRRILFDTNEKILEEISKANPKKVIIKEGDL